MSDKVRIEASRTPDGCVLDVWVEDPDLAGKRATLKVVQHARVKRGSPVHAQRVLHEIDLTLTHGQNRVALGAALAEAVHYEGTQLDLLLKAELEIDDGLIFDTEVSADLRMACQLPERTAIQGDAKHVHSPPDRFDFFANLRAIPPQARAMVLWLLIAGLPLIVGNALLGVRDQMVPESRAWFYDKTGDDGSESPLQKALTASGAAGLALWLAIRKQLRRYMSFEAKLPGGRIARDFRCRAADIFDGKARVPLERAQVRLVAYNCEHGQYTTTEKQGNSSRTVTRSFSNDARGVVLFDRYLPLVPADVPLAQYIDDDINFTPLFDSLYPPCRVGTEHGLSVKLEAQLLHPDFVDQDIVLEPGDLAGADFHRRTV